MKNEKEKNFITIRETSKITGLESQTIRKLFDNQKIAGYKTPSGQRRIDKQSVQRMCNIVSDGENKYQFQRNNFMYARVSTKKQVDDLSRQIEYIKRPEYADYILIQDIGSGINFKRKGLQRILESCLQGTIGEIVIAHRDRLCRFGFELIEQLVTKSGGKITVIKNEQLSSPESELADDLLAIIHIFSCKQMGRRSYNTKKRSEDDNDKNIS